MRRTMLVLVCALLAFPAIAQTTLNGAGATFPYPMYSKWFSEYHKLHPDIQINYQSIGSGGGIRQVINGTVDFGASDGPMTDEMLKEAKTKILHMPTVLGADVPAYNIPGVTAKLKFTAEALAGIFLGKITKWNDKTMTSANPGVNLPDRDIIVVHRSDGSGTTYIWTDYLSKISSEWQSQVGRGTSVKWPIGLGGKGNEGVAGSIRQLQGSIGYVELIYAVQNNINYGSVEERGGEFRESVAGKCDGGGGFGAQNAGRLPGLDYECAGKRRISDFQLYLAADSRAIEGCGEGKDPGRFSELDGHRWAKDDGSTFLRAAPGKRCAKREGCNQAGSIV